MPMDAFHALGAAAGALVIMVALQHLWPFTTPTAGYNTTLHILNAYMLLPVGLVIMFRELSRAGVANATSILGPKFDPLLDLISSDSRYAGVLFWSSLICWSFDGVAILGFLLCVCRAGTLIEQVRKLVDQGIDKLEEKGIKIPGLTNPKQPPPSED